MNINRVVLTGNLTRDPDVRATPGGLSICKFGIAVNTRRKSGDQWEEKPNFFRVTVFGRQADTCGQYLKKGRPVAIDGRLEWSTWETEGQKRESVDIIADTVQFLSGPSEASGNGNGYSSGVRPVESDRSTLVRGFILLALGTLIWTLLPCGAVRTVTAFVVGFYQLGFLWAGLKAVSHLSVGRPWPARLAAAVLFVVGLVVANIACSVLKIALEGI